MTEGPQYPYQQGQQPGHQPAPSGQQGQPGQYRPTQQYPYPGGPSGYPAPGGLPTVTTTPPAARGPRLGALVALRGCPMCWTIGLVETLGDSLRRLRERLG